MSNNIEPSLNLIRIFETFDLSCLAARYNDSEEVDFVHFRVAANDTGKSLYPVPPHRLHQ